MAPPLTVAPSPEALAASAYEQANVHEVYNLIATHFSATRYKQWPSITKFLHSLSPGSLGLDAGCGNGKYLPAWDADEAKSKGCYMIGLDRSDKLLELARRCGYEFGQEGLRECLVADVLNLGGVRAGSMDFAISIATLHHISLPVRRLLTVQTFLRCLSPTNGRGMIYVWALEQSAESRRHAPGEDLEKGEGEQDVFVPWVMSKEAPRSTKEALGPKKEKAKKVQKGKKVPPTAASETGSTSAPTVSEITSTLASTPLDADSSTPSTLPPPPPASPPKVYQRYYHLFRALELSQLIAAACEAESIVYLPLVPTSESADDQRARVDKEAVLVGKDGAWCRLTEEFWEKDNWVCTLRRGKGADGLRSP